MWDHIWYVVRETNNTVSCHRIKLLESLNVLLLLSFLTKCSQVDVSHNIRARCLLDFMNFEMNLFISGADTIEGTSGDFNNKTF